MNRQTLIGSVLPAILVILILLGVCGFIAYFTNGFTSDFETFYLEADDKLLILPTNLGPFVKFYYEGADEIYEVTDAENKYLFSDYYTVKIINCIIMMIVSVVYILLKQYSDYKALVVFLVCFYRMLDGYADVFEAQFHKEGRLDLAGKSMAFRTIISVLVYFVILGITLIMLQ